MTNSLKLFCYSNAQYMKVLIFLCFFASIRLLNFDNFFLLLIDCFLVLVLLHLFYYSCAYDDVNFLYAIMFYIHEKIQIIGILFLPPSKFGIVKVLIFFFNLLELILQVMINKTNNQPLLSGEWWCCQNKNHQIWCICTGSSIFFCVRIFILVHFFYDG
jgi:hypothetical protein